MERRGLTRTKGSECYPKERDDFAIMEVGGALRE
jgi:hypothetical protein